MYHPYFSLTSREAMLLACVWYEHATEHYTFDDSDVSGHIISLFPNSRMVLLTNMSTRWLDAAYYPSNWQPMC